MARKVTWHNVTASYSQQEMDFMRQLRGQEVNRRVVGSGPGPRNVLGSDGVVYSWRTWKWKQEAIKRRKRECWFVHVAKAEFKGRLR